uniref:hypothetical protein n=1 Tax=Burkholderia cepacia TaxID=292 RepID=UPI002ABD82F8
MFESTVLKMSNRERQQALAQQEETYDKRRRALKEREENLQYRQQLAKENPQAALDAMNVDAQSREAAREQAALAAKVKKQFGVDGHEIIDTPEVRSALEQALAEHTEKQRDREKQLEE